MLLQPLTFQVMLMNEMRRLGLAGTEMEQAQCETIRLNLLKISAQAQVIVRRVIVRLACSYPYPRREEAPTPFGLNSTKMA